MRLNNSSKGFMLIYILPILALMVSSMLVLSFVVQYKYADNKRMDRTVEQVNDLASERNLARYLEGQVVEEGEIEVILE